MLVYYFKNFLICVGVDLDVMRAGGKNVFRVFYDKFPFTSAVLTERITIRVLDFDLLFRVNSFFIEHFFGVIY